MNLHGRWIALMGVCGGILLVSLDGTIVTVALPRIESDLHVRETLLVWLVNAYLLAYGGALLVGGKLSDLYGRRRVFLVGIGLFGAASLICGWSATQTVLIAARALQGSAAAILTSGALSLVTHLFTDVQERAKAMAFYSFTFAAGCSGGTVLGGVITQNLSWHWIFLINVPLSLAGFIYCGLMLPPDSKATTSARIDISGAVLITLSLTFATYCLTLGSELGWTTVETRMSLTASGALLLLFLIAEMRTNDPLIPLQLLQDRNFVIASALGMIWAAEAYAWSIALTLYCQRVLDYNPMQTGLAFLPFSGLTAILSVTLSARLITRYGVRRPLGFGLLLISMGLALLAYMPIRGALLFEALPAMTLIGVGSGVAPNALLLAAMGNVKQTESGVASGLINTSFVLGGTIGMTFLLNLAAAHTHTLQSAGQPFLVSLGSGYRLVFGTGAMLTSLAGVLGYWFLRERNTASFERSSMSSHI